MFQWSDIMCFLLGVEELTGRNTVPNFQNIKIYSFNLAKFSRSTCKRVNFLTKK